MRASRVGSLLADMPLTKRPTESTFAFRLRAPRSPQIQLPASATEITAAALAEADRFETKVKRWSGPEDYDEDGCQPYARQQLFFDLKPWGQAVDLESVLRGIVQVYRREDGRADYVMRDHHMLDVVCCEYALTGSLDSLPNLLFHADRHSDWCNDRTLIHLRTPDQAATWWKLLAGLKRPTSPEPGDPPDGDAPLESVLRERDVSSDREWPSKPDIGLLLSPGGVHHSKSRTPGKARVSFATLILVLSMASLSNAVAIDEWSRCRCPSARAHAPYPYIL